MTKLSTITKYAYERVEKGFSMQGVIEVRTDTPIGQVIEDILLILECIATGELLYLPM